MNPQDEARLEKAVHAALRRLPERKAPSSLEGRVLAEIARRAALPWWRRSFAHWPAAIRAAFLAASVLVAALTAAGLFLLWQTPGGHQVSSSLSGAYAWALYLRGLAYSAGGTVRLLLSHVSPVLLYGGAAAITLLYASAAILGAFAYKAFSPSGRAA